MRGWFLTVVLGVALSAGSTASAFKPGKPTKPRVYSDATGRYVATLTPTKGYASKVTVVTPKERFTWPGTTAIPAKGMIAPKTGQVILLGGYGNPGVRLGKVAIYEFTGRLVHSLDLRKHIPLLVAARARPG